MYHYYSHFRDGKIEAKGSGFSQGHTASEWQNGTQPGSGAQALNSCALLPVCIKYGNSGMMASVGHFTYFIQFHFYNQVIYFFFNSQGN